MVRVLVVDASVLHAAGGTTAVDSTSLKSSLALIAIIEAELSVAMTPLILKEWHDHASSYSTSWIRDMFSRRLIKRQAADYVLHSSLTAHAKKRLGAAQYAALLSDEHLVGAALALDKRVVSLDTAMQQILRTLAPSYSLLNDFYWVQSNTDECVAWLSAGTPTDATLTL